MQEPVFNSSLSMDENNKRRYAYNETGTGIRAVQGHRIEGVEIEPGRPFPPNLLYHGMAARFLSAIWKEGLRPMNQRFVHISPDFDTAVAAGKRHGEPVVLAIRAQDLVKDGYDLFLAENGVWLAKEVPSFYFTEHYPQKSLEELRLLYQEARKIEPAVALKLVQAAQSDEERYFYAHIHNMNLQRAQKLAIERNLF